MRRHVLAAVCAFVGLTTFAVGTLEAQGNRPNQPPQPPPTGGGGVQPLAGGGGGGGNGYPTITLVAPQPQTTTSQYPYIEIIWCDNEEELNAASRFVKVNGVTVTSSFTYDLIAGCAGERRRSTTTSVALNMRSNWINAYICDVVDAGPPHCANMLWEVVRMAPGPPSIALRNFNGDNQDRGLCLTVGAGQAAALSCGDLVVTHAMPAYRTMGRDRSLTLIYNSATAAPRPVVAAWVTQPSGNGTPNSVLAELRVSNVVRASATYNPVPAGTTRQIALSFDASDLSTGVHPFTLVVQNQYPDVYSDTVGGELLIVNRAFSEFGAGWWVAGVEYLGFVGVNGRRLWIGGDGSAALYDIAGTDVWVRATGAFRDTLTWNGSYYLRRLRHGVEVHYDASGRHIRTVNRAGHTTTFTWTSSRLTSIQVPPGGSSSTYTLAWEAGTNLLDAITDPAGRVLNATTTAGNLVQLTDPDNVAVQFTYDGSRRMDRRVSRRGYSTWYAYGNGLHVTRVAVPVLSSTVDSSRTTFQWWDEQGLRVGVSGGTTAPADTTLSYTKVFGPRVNVADDATFWVDRWGAPVRVQDPVGNVTTVTRGDPANPAVATRLRFPDGRVVRMAYDSPRARLLTVTDSAFDATGGTPTNAVTTYTYNDPDNPDAPDAVTDPTGVTARFFYQPGTGLTERVVAPDSHVTLFSYYTGAFAGLLQSVTDSAVQVTTDSTTFTESTQSLTTQFVLNALGNDSIAISPSGNTTVVARDAAQRVRFVTDAMGHRTEYVYNGSDWLAQVIRHVEDQVPFLPPVQTAGYAYSTDGMVTQVIEPRGANRSYDYDAANRPTTMADDYGVVETTFYGPAGLVDSVLTRRGHKIRHRYDAAGRDTMTWWPAETIWGGTPIPGDTIRTIYDAMSRRVRATNGQGSVRFAYWRDGSVRSDSQFNGTSPLFVNWYRYDLAGRRTWYFNGLDTITYGYAPASGNLTAIRVNWQGSAIPNDSVLFTWDALGRRRTVRYTNNTLMRFTHDRDGALRYVCSLRPGSPLSGEQDAIQFQVRVPSTNRDGHATRRIHEHAAQCNTGLGGWNRSNDSSAFNVLDQLYYQSSLIGGSSYSANTYEYDLSGNLTRRTDNLGVVYDYAVAPGHNRLQTQSRNGSLALSYQHNAAGDRTQETNFIGTPDPTRQLRYDAAGRLNGTRHLVGGNVWLENLNSVHYDALGRRFNTCDGACLLEGYDGANLTRIAGTDTWRFVNGPGLDDPLVGLRGTQRYFFFTDGAGRHIVTTDTAGVDAGALGAVAAGATDRAHTFGANRAPAPSAAQSGFSYFRNRYYDQATGRWTQEDPIGPAGGINLYQYAGNNPVTFSDPFGLCPEWLDGIPCIDVIDSPMKPADSPEPSGIGGSEFGYTRSNGNQWHNGLDWRAPAGTAVRAPAAATVTAVSSTGKSGNFVVIDLGNGATVTVSHLSGFAGGLRPGETRRVAAGTALGYVGRTGNAARSPRETHGHVVTRVDGLLCEPRAFFSPDGSAMRCLTGTK